MRLLILDVEDEVDHFEYVQEYFPPSVAILDNCNSIRAAVRLLQEKDYHLVILDLGLKDTSGSETLDEWERLGREEPFVVLSSMKDADIVDRVTKNTKALSFEIKPKDAFGWRTLSAKIQSWALKEVENRAREEINKLNKRIEEKTMTPKQLAEYAKWAYPSHQPKHNKINTRFDKFTWFDVSRTNSCGFVGSTGTDLVVAFKGSGANWIDWIVINADRRQEQFFDSNHIQRGYVHRGFAAAARASLQSIGGYSGDPAGILAEHGLGKKRFWLVGHSRGGAEATLAASYMLDYSPRVATFGCPRVGDSEYCKWINGVIKEDKHGASIVHHIQKGDSVPKIPWDLWWWGRSYKRPGLDRIYGNYKPFWRYPHSMVGYEEIVPG